MGEVGGDVFLCRGGGTMSPVVLEDNGILTIVYIEGLDGAGHGGDVGGWMRLKSRGGVMLEWEGGMCVGCCFPKLKLKLASGPHMIIQMQCRRPRKNPTSRVKSRTRKDRGWPNMTAFPAVSPGLPHSQAWEDTCWWLVGVNWPRNSTT